MITHVVATQLFDQGIGYKNRLMYSIREDMQHFTRLTTGHIVLMGRKTFESMDSKPLKNRVNIVLSRMLDVEPNEHDLNKPVHVFHRLSDALRWIHRYYPTLTIFVIGGSDIYRETLSITDRVVMTVIDGFKPADTFYPVLSNDEWMQEEGPVLEGVNRMTYEKVTYRIVNYFRSLNSPANRSSSVPPPI
jgi:dihydrofolate reductase